MKNNLIREFVFWGIWLVIPLVVDIISGLISGFVVLVGYFKRKKEDIEYLPHVTLLIPLYNSEKTLASCLKSIVEQNYPLKNIMVLLINNGQKDKAYEVFCSFQEQNPGLRLWWIDSSQGKAKALNKGLYMAEGKYIINIDSDGILDKNAVRRVVEKFESNTDIYAMTGVVLIDNNLIEKTKKLSLRLVQRCELFEYTEAFLVGRGFQSYSNTMFTLAGAFSCYRKDVVLKTQLYNNETLGEDTHMTSQIREFLKGKVALCEDAFFYVDPIDNLDKLYIQRQRWQRGQVEVSSLFKDIGSNRGFRNVLKYTMIKDHTFVFPRFIWIFAMIYLIFLDYPLKLIVGANIIMYMVYVFNSFIYFLITKLYLNELKQVINYMNKHWYTILLLPMYRFIVFFMRVAGIINSVEKYAAWNSRTFTEEKKVVTEKLGKRLKLYYKIKDWINNE
ncbi:TIGR03111 family XrtG-associated glycosyltransferase [Clostridium aciditolerans]|uniref:Glycosyltransferase, exosortase G system-associated n=1 Tax=Clostridium aciditolerans TaxID=339861 RepID=A0A934HX90_9CLOT|nr:putative glycosyltransferase, exosortase G system-associated [Clostridium aciditolerans]